MILTHDSKEWSSVVGIDPGGTTGLCAVRLAGMKGVPLADRLQLAQPWMAQEAIDTREKGLGAPLHVGEARIQHRIAELLVRLAADWGVGCLHLAIEDFVVRERTQDRSLLSPVRMTSGILSLLEASETPVVVHFNSASDAKSTISDKTLKRFGFYKAGKPHANDAARHALLVLRKELV